MAEAAGNAVCARFETAVVSAACRLVAVAFAVAPMVNWLVPGGEAVVACSVMVWLEPSGSVRPNEIVSPGFGLEPRLTEIDGGEPVTVAPVRFELTLASLKPKGELSELSVTLGAVPPIVSRPRLPTPSSACRRSEITCVRPA